jgi:hypothetical protein
MPEESRRERSNLQTAITLDELGTRELAAST